VRSAKGVISGQIFDRNSDGKQFQKGVLISMRKDSLLISKSSIKHRLVIFVIGISIISGVFLISTATKGEAKSGTNDAVVDFDGDGKTDVSIMRATGIGATYDWWILNSSNGNITTLPFGVRPRDIPAPADYDGDGKDDIAMWRNSPFTGEVSTFYIIYSSTGATAIIPFGQNGDIPVVDDYDGDGKDDLAVWRAPAAAGGAGQAIWYYRGTLNNPNQNITYVPWGARYGTNINQKDEPYPGDFDGDGKADFRVQRPVDTTLIGTGPAIFYTLTATGNVSYDYYSLADDRIVPGDYDGDGKTDICVARGFNISPGNTTWYIRYSSGIPDSQTIFGFGFNFAQGDYDGDGKTDIGYFMTPVDPEAIGFWYLSSANNREARFIRWGSRPALPSPGAGDLPIAGYNNR
jgi:hypothetical protein